MKNYLLRVLILLLISSLTNAQDLSQENIEPMNADTLKKFMKQTIDDYNTVGLAVSIFTCDKILNEEISGVRKLHTDDSLKITDKFHIGSNGKPMTGFVAGRLVEKRMISWDTKFLDVFPELKDSINSSYQNITFSELLSHRSRVQPFTDGDEFEALPNFRVDDETQKRYAFAKWLMRQTPVEFGSTKLDSIMSFTYSNAGYAVAALMMEKVTGKEWKTLINDELFKLLGIEASFGWPALTDEKQPWGHWIDEGDSLLTPHSPGDSYKLEKFISPAGDYSISILDHTKFLQVNLMGITGKDTLLTSSTYKYLHYCNLEKDAPTLVRYSIGWFANELTSSHNGSAGTFMSRTRLYPKKGYGIIIETNTCDRNSYIGVKKLIKSINNYYD